MRERQTEQRETDSCISVLLRNLYLSEVHAQTDLREQMHDDALVLLHRLPLAVIIAVIVAIERG